MAKRGRPPISSVGRSIRAAIAHLTVSSQPYANMEDKVRGAAEELMRQSMVEAAPDNSPEQMVSCSHWGLFPARRWKTLGDMGSERSIYTWLKQFREDGEKSNRVNDINSG